MRPLKLLSLLSLLWMLCLCPLCAQFQGRKVVIDAGHGGTDPGAIGFDGSAYPNEEDFVLDVVQRLQAKLVSAGCTVVLTRDMDETVSLTARRDLTNTEAPDLFLSVHCNSFTDPSAHGTETFWWTSGNAADESLATKIQAKQQQYFGLTNRGVKQANYTVITSTPPAALAEMMFISNQAEFDLMNATATRANAAQAFYEAAANFLGIDLTAPVITSQPVSLIRAAGNTATYTASVTGTGLTYSWKKDGVSLANSGRITGATSPQLSIQNVQLADAGFYTLAITHATAVLLTEPAQLTITTPSFPVGTGNGVRGEYFDNVNFTSQRRVRTDTQINFDWGSGGPSPEVQPDSFSARWTGELEPLYSQTYTFHLTADDGVRLWINNLLIFDKWTATNNNTWTASLPLTAGVKVKLKLEYAEATGDAAVQLAWSAASQEKQPIPSTQLYRSPPVFPASPVVSLLAGAPYQSVVTAAGFDPLLSYQPLVDFESFADATNDQVLFRSPSLSSTTATFLDVAKPFSTTVTSTLPVGNTSNRALRVQWSFLSTAATPWLRLTTFNTAYFGNPVIDFRKSLQFDAYTTKRLNCGLGLRETNATAALGADGGLSGPIEFGGVTSVTSGVPSPTRSLPSNVWTTQEFILPQESVRPFTGNGILESTTGLGVLESLVLSPTAAVDDDHVLYLDNFVLLERNALTYSLIAPPPGASIHPLTGLLRWTPPTTLAGPQSFTVRATDAGSPARFTDQTLNFIVAPAPSITTVEKSGNNLRIGWISVSGASYDIEANDNLASPWTVLGTIQATANATIYQVPLSTTKRFFRVRLQISP